MVLFIYGKGKQSPVHLTLEIDSPGPGAAEADVKKVLSGREPSISISLDDEFLVFNAGTGSGGYGSALDDRLRTADNSPLRDVIMPVVDTVAASRNDRDQVTGPVQVVDFVAVHLDNVIEVEVEDPNNPGRTITIDLLVGTVGRQIVQSGSQRLAKRAAGLNPKAPNAQTVAVSRLVQ